VIHGEQDKLVSFRNLKFISEEVPHSKAVAVAGAGHIILWEQPKVVVDEILAILRPSAD